MKLLTIFTPTYNRAYILPKLYESLYRQTCRAFEWVIVDDGSSDGTDALVAEWIERGAVEITYLRQPNQGKHIAINTGVAAARGELFFIVDSDDHLTEDAVQKVLAFWENSHPGDDISGILSYRQFFDGRIVGTKLPPKVHRCKLRETVKYGSTGDKVVIYRSAVLRQYPFPKFGSERFLGESYVYNRIDAAYDMLVMDDFVYFFDYQRDGLSQDFRKLYRQNPQGFLAVFETERPFCDTFAQKVRNHAHILCLSLRLGRATEALSQSRTLPALVAIPLSIYLYFKIFILKFSDVKPFTQSADK